MEHVPLSHSIGVTAPGEEAVYFLAPERYLGDQRASYNHLLQFRLRIGDYDRPIPTATDIILEGGGVSVTNTIFAQQNKIPSNVVRIFHHTIIHSFCTMFCFICNNPAVIKKNASMKGLSPQIPIPHYLLYKI